MTSFTPPAPSGKKGAGSLKHPGLITELVLEMERKEKLTGKCLLWTDVPCTFVFDPPINLKEKFHQENLEGLRSDRMGIQTQVSLTSKSSGD